MLTAMIVRGATPGARPYKLADEKGLFLYVAPSGLRSWRMKFRFDGKEKLLTFGSYPELGLVDARDRRDEARQLLRQHQDPSGRRHRARQLAAARDGATTFECTALAWHALHARRWSTVHAGDVLASLRRHVFAAIGALPLEEIDAPAILRVLRAVERDGRLETARRLRQRISAVFQHAMSEGIATSDPAAIVTRALLPPDGKRHQPAVGDVDAARAALCSIEGAAAAVTTKLASRLLALTAVRLAAVRGAAWDEFYGIEWEGAGDAPAAVWRIPASRMKLTRARKRDQAHGHLVPLSRQAVDVLRAARQRCGGATLVFPGTRAGRLPLSESALSNLYQRAGLRGRHVPHGWRAAFSTILNERRPADRAAIDLALAHVPKDKVEAAYNRSDQLGRRRELFQEWADILLEQAPPAALITSGLATR